LKPEEQSADDYVVERVMRINTEIGKAFVFSSGKDMGVFKGVGYPEDIAEYFCLEEYSGYNWVCHGRFPTNTPGWWGGAHPFNILDWTVIHNGELSSYGTNRRFLEMHGYKCTMQTDTEVMTYAFDLLMRKQGLPIEIVSKILAPPFWTEIDSLDPEQKRHKARFVGTGMHGRVVYIHGEVASISKEAESAKLTEEDWKIIHEFCEYFKFDADKILEQNFKKIILVSHRPYGRLYAY